MYTYYYFILASSAMALLTAVIIAIIFFKFKKVKQLEAKEKAKSYLSQEIVSTSHLELREDAISDEMNSVAQRFLDYFEREKPYLNPDIRIVDVAEKLFTNKTYLSRAINIKFGKNFSQLVHWFRIRDAIDIYTSDTHKTMQELHLQVGFRSMSTFNTAFSRYTGKTPAEWCKYYKKLEKNVW